MGAPSLVLLLSTFSLRIGCSREPLKCALAQLHANICLLASSQASSQESQGQNLRVCSQLTALEVALETA